MHFLWPCSLAVPVLAGWVYAFLWFCVQELPKAQPAVVLVLKCLRRRGNGLKSHALDKVKLTRYHSEYTMTVYSS